MLWRLVAVCVGLVGSVTGCGSGARFVQSDAAGGTVAIPANTNSWPTYHRDKAEELIRQKCPGGYEIVSEREVTTGRVAHTNAQTDTQESPALVLAGQNPDPRTGRRDPNAFAGAVVPLGDTRQRTAQTTTYSDVKEWRIVYRAKSANPDPPPAAAPGAAAGPG